MWKIKCDQLSDGLRVQTILANEGLHNLEMQDSPVYKDDVLCSNNSVETKDQGIQDTK